MRNAARHRLPLAVGAVALVCILLAFVPDAVSSELAFDREAILAGEVWRLWTGHLVHFSFGQLLLDVSVLLLAGRIVEDELGAGFTGALLSIAMPAISLGMLLLSPDLLEYRGASGIATLFAFAAGMLLWKGSRELRTALSLLGILFAMKIGLDAMGMGLGMTSLPEGIRVAWQAHLIGAAIGWLTIFWPRHHALGGWHYARAIDWLGENGRLPNSASSG